jgi:hypothetical protein
MLPNKAQKPTKRGRLHLGTLRTRQSSRRASQLSAAR